MEEIWYRSLGWCAGLGSRLSRSSINLLPMSLAPILFGFLLTLAGLSFVFELDPDGPKLPGEPFLYLPIPLIVGFLTSIYASAWTRQWIIFRPTGQSAVDEELDARWRERPEPSGIPMRVSGRMVLDPTWSQRFLEMPALWERRPDGAFAIASNIDASVKTSLYFIPTDTKLRRGRWYMVLAPGSVSNIEIGILYVGSNELPAVRFSCVDALRNIRERSVLSASSGEVRDKLAYFLDYATRLPSAEPLRQA